MTRRVTLAALLVLPLGLLLVLAPLIAAQQAQACEPTVSWTGGTAAGMDDEQTGNATIIARIALEMGMGSDAAVIGVMTALTESSLKNLSYGDAAGPDSRGLFQQRTSWGRLSVRMDPAGASRLFYQALQDVPGWSDLPPHLAAQAVQRSAYADGSNYAPHYPTARAVVRRVLAEEETEMAASAVVDGCPEPVAFSENNSRPLPGARTAVRRAMALVGSHGYYRLCARLAANIWGHPHAGYYSAADQWDAMITARHAHPGDRQPPVGALLFWDTAGIYGHVAVHVGDGRIVSNDIGDTYEGEGGVYLVDVAAIEKEWGATYLGWTPPKYQG